MEKIFHFVTENWDVGISLMIVCAIIHFLSKCEIVIRYPNSKPDESCQENPINGK